MCAGFNILGGLVFGIFASGEVEEWAKDEKVEARYVTKM